MTLGKALIVYGASLVAFLGIDAVWLATMSDRFYRKQLGDLMRDDPDLGVALAFYLLYVAGVLLLVVLPAAEKGSLLQPSASERFSAWSRTGPTTSPTSRPCATGPSS